MINFDFITLPFKNKLASMRFENATVNIANQQLAEASVLVPEDPDAKRWLLVGSTDGKSLTQEDRNTMQAQALILSRFNPHAKGVLDNAVKYICGKGIVVTSQDSNPEVQEKWDKFWLDNKMDQRQKEIVRRTLRDGEVFLRYLRGTEAFDGETRVRFIPTTQIANANDMKPQDGWMDGIRTDPDDVETPTEYSRVKLSPTGKEEKDTFPAEDIQHIKIIVDSEERRGVSFLLASLQDLTYYRRWLKDRVILNKVRSAVVMVKTVKGGPASVTAIADNIQDKSATAAQTSKRTYKSGTTLVKNEAVDYDFKSPNLQARDTAQDGRNILLSVGAGVGQPEYIFTSDASNANFASTMVSESPFIRGTEDWQHFFESEFKMMYAIVIGHLIATGMLPATSEETIIVDGKEVTQKCDTKTTCDIQWPEFTHRKIKEETDALAIQRTEGIVSRRTMSSKLDLDYEEEQRLLAKEAEEDEAREDEFEKEREKALKDKEIEDPEDIEDEPGPGEDE